MATATITHITEQLSEKLHLHSESKAEAKQPDISYHPDVENWHNRTARRLAEDPSLPKTALPEGFPKKLDSPLVWQGSDWKNEQEWVYNLNTEQLKEIDDAVKHFKSQYTPLRHPL